MQGFALMLIPTPPLGQFLNEALADSCYNVLTSDLCSYTFADFTLKRSLSEL